MVNLDQTPAVELPQLQWAENKQSDRRLALPVQANRGQTTSKINVFEIIDFIKKEEATTEMKLE